MLTMDDRTEPTACTARVVRGDRVRVNRALAERLAVTHRMIYSFDFPPPGTVVELTPEEKLLRAIFGDAIGEDAKYETPEVGASIVRGDWLIGHSPPKVSFWEAPRGEVEKAERVGDRVTVTVRWPGPLTIGDELRDLGIIEEIVDDGDSDPTAYSPSREGTMRVERVLPSAMQRVLARSVGPYDTVTRAPKSGAIVRDDQLEWLARSGGRAIVSEVAVYTTGDPVYGPRVYEDLVRGGSIADGWTAVHPPPDSAAAKKDEGGEL